MREHARGVSHLFNTQAVCHTAKEVLKITLLPFLPGLWACTYSICFNTCSTCASCSYLFHSHFSRLILQSIAHRKKGTFDSQCVTTQWPMGQKFPGRAVCFKKLSSIPSLQHNYEIGGSLDEKTHTAV